MADKFIRELALRLEEEPQEVVMQELPQFFKAVTNNDVVPAHGTSKEFNVLVFNMERGVHLTEICELIRCCLEKETYDIIIANELDWGCLRSGNTDVALEFAKKTGFNYAWGLEFIELVNEKDELGYHGNAIFAKHPILNAGVLRLPEEYNWYFDRQRRIGGRLAVYAELDIGGARTAVFSVHLENRTDGEGRKRQMKTVLDFAEAKFKDIPIIIGGDLNTNTFDGRSIEDITKIAKDKALQRRCIEDVFSYEPLLLMCQEAGYEIYPAEPHVTRRKPLPSGRDMSLRLDWILTRGIGAQAEGMLRTDREAIVSAYDSPILKSFKGKELSDHNAVWIRTL